MRRFLGFLKKEFYHILRDPRTLLILFGMPIAQVLLFGFAITNEIRDARIGIYDLSHDHITHEITDKLLSSGYFLLEEEIGSPQQIEAIFRKGEVKEVIIFEPEFADKLHKEGRAAIQILADASDPNMANTLVNYTTFILNDYSQSFAGAAQLPFRIVPEIKMIYNPELKGVFMFVPGVITIILMLISAMMTSISIAKEKELGTMEVLMVSPLTRIPIILGKVFPYILLAFGDAVIVLLMGALVFGMPLEGSLILLLLECILFILTALSLGILISTVADSQQTAMMASMMGLMLPTILLSGFIFPIESMPVPLQAISNIIPAKWFIIIIRGIMLKGIGLEHLWRETLILFGMMVIFIGIASRKFKLQL
jgi:ABC-2 type transport system permease protein